MNALVIDKKDSVAVVTQIVEKGEQIQFLLGEEEKNITAVTDIPIYHKVSIKDITKGEYVVKYGEHIGKASEEIKSGAHVHEHNLTSHREDLKNENGD